MAGGITLLLNVLAQAVQQLHGVGLLAGGEGGPRCSGIALRGRSPLLRPLGWRGCIRGWWLPLSARLSGSKRVDPFNQAMHAEHADCTHQNRN